MQRKNNNAQIIDYTNTIKQSNDISMAKLNQNLKLNQIQLLAFAIFSTQQNGETHFRKYEFQKKFGLRNYKTEEAYEDSDKVSSLRFSTQDIENDKFSFTNVFRSIVYENGTFTFKWNEDMLPHILELKEKYVLTDLTITAKFKSGFSWILYDYLRANYGSWRKELTKEALMNLFAVEDRETYQQRTSDFKRGVLDIAVQEVNNFTELEVWYTDVKVGNKITGFIINWSAGKIEGKATKEQINLLREIVSEVENKSFHYLTVKDSYLLDLARKFTMEFREIIEQIDDTLTSKKANELIRESKAYYEKLESILEKDGWKRDTSVYFDWTKGEE